MINRLVAAADALVIYPEQFQGQQYNQYIELKQAVAAITRLASREATIHEVKRQFEEESG